MPKKNKLGKGNATAVGFQALPVSHQPTGAREIKTGGLVPPNSGAPYDQHMADGMKVDEAEGGEDDTSALSEGDDFQQDLEDALDNSNFSFTGNFYHASILTNAPNPGLHISGLGLVGLPLSERDARAIVSNAILAPFGHGERTIVDKDVRDTWEIEPSKIMFGNPEWKKYIDGVVCLEVCKALGVLIGNSPPKMELYKLLLYEKGSHFLPHQDTQKANGMFATVVIILPSAYEGGQVVVSHASTTKTIEFAPNSFFSTAVLAWYTDVKHEVKPIASGYRLVLTYNLIHVAPPGVPEPAFPRMSDSVQRFRRVLRKWREGQYAKVPEMPLLAYVLRHEYSSRNLMDGLKALKGADAHLVTSLRDVAEEMGYVVGLATLGRHVHGPGDDCGGGYHRRNRYDYCSSSEEDEVPDMMEVTETKTSLTSLVDLGGISLLPVGEIELEDSNLIPRDPFEDTAPNKVEYEGYMGNGAGDVSHWYHHTVLVLMHENDVDSVCFSIAGVSYAFQKLATLSAENSPKPTAEAKVWVDRIVSKSGQLNKGQARKMVDLAVTWKDVEVFNTMMRSPACTLSVLSQDVLLNAWKVFSFEAVRSSFEQALARSLGFSDRMKLIYAVKSKVSTEEEQVVDPWCKKETDKILASYTQPDVKDIPVIMSVIRHSGWSPFVKTLLPTFLQRSHTYGFLIALVKALQEARPSLVDQLANAEATDRKQPESASGSATEGDGKNPVDKVIEEALEAASKQWSSSSGSYAQTDKVGRIVEIIEQAIISDNMKICRTLFVDILKGKGAPPYKFTQIYIPLIPRIRALLKSKNFDLCAPPFVDLFQVLIGTYLRDILGKKGQQNIRLRKIGCGCQDCQPLDKFILDPTTRSTIFRLVQQRRVHLERQITAASDLCTYQTIKSGSPHGLEVTKLSAVVEASTWELRQQEARKFMSSFGMDEDVKKIMGVRCADVVAAINGTEPFGAKIPFLATSNIIPSATATRKSMVGRPATATIVGSSSTANRDLVALPTQIDPPPRVAGKKRKSNPAVNLGVIDLT